MISLDFDLEGRGKPAILCLGAHSDDLEIGAIGTILGLAQRFPSASVTWAVFGAAGQREEEARASAQYCTARFADPRIEVYSFRDGFFPAEAVAIKEQFEALKAARWPDIIFTHYRHDLHQDHRMISDLTWQTFRDHLILEYEIPKYDGDFGSPNVFHALSDALREEKLAVLERFFSSQRSKRWFSRDTFSAVMRLRGIECNSKTGFAEAFYCRKVVF